MDILIFGSLFLGLALIGWVVVSMFKKQPVQEKPKLQPPPEIQNRKHNSKRATKPQIKQTVSRLQRVRDRYQNAGDYHNVQIINQYIDRTRDPLITLIELEMLENALSSSSQSNDYTPDVFSGSGGNFGGAGASAAWIASQSNDNS